MVDGRGSEGRIMDRRSFIKSMIGGLGLTLMPTVGSGASFASDSVEPKFHNRHFTQTESFEYSVVPFSDRWVSIVQHGRMQWIGMDDPGFPRAVFADKMAKPCKIGDALDCGVGEAFFDRWYISPIIAKDGGPVSERRWKYSLLLNAQGCFGLGGIIKGWKYAEFVIPEVTPGLIRKHRSFGESEDGQGKLFITAHCWDASL